MIWLMQQKHQTWTTWWLWKFPRNLLSTSTNKKKAYNQPYNHRKEMMCTALCGNKWWEPLVEMETNAMSKGIKCIRFPAPWTLEPQQHWFVMINHMGWYSQTPNQISKWAVTEVKPRKVRRSKRYMVKNFKYHVRTPRQFVQIQVNWT